MNRITFLNKLRQRITPNAFTCSGSLFICLGFVLGFLKFPAMCVSLLFSGVLVLAYRNELTMITQEEIAERVKTLKRNEP